MSYHPKRGDVVWLDFDPQAGREQALRRPALVLSPGQYNNKTGLAIVCPITTKTKDYPFEVCIPAGFDVSGVVLSDHVRSADWRARKADFICTVDSGTLDDVSAKIQALLP